MRQMMDIGDEANEFKPATYQLPITADTDLDYPNQLIFESHFPACSTLSRI